MLSIKEILAETDDIGYSDYHISGNMPVMVRFHGDLRPLNDEILSKGCLSRRNILEIERGWESYDIHCAWNAEVPIESFTSEDG